MIYKERLRRERRARRSGSVVVLSMLAMVSLLGFCALGVDYGVLVATKNRLQRTCDAAALAGAAELPASNQTRANVATYYAQQAAIANGVATSEITISYPATNEIQVAATRTANSLFARALGIMNTQVRAHSRAGRSPLSGVPGVVPMAITIEDYNRYKGGASFAQRLIRNHDEDFNNGTLVTMDLRPDNNGKSGSKMQGDIENGYPDQVFLNQQINNVINASINSQGNKLEDALQTRFERAAGAPWYDDGLGVRYQFPDYPADDPRIVTILICDPNEADNSNPMTTARFFAPVYLESVLPADIDDGDGVANIGGLHVRMRILPTRDYSSADPNVTVGDANTPDTGVGVVRLLS